MLAMAVERTREHGEGLSAANVSILGGALDSYEKYCHGQPKQIGALSITYHCHCCQCFDGKWFLCTGVSKGMKNKGSKWFCGSHISTWRAGRLYR